MADRVVIVGAGIGGLAAALRLAHAGCAVTVIEAANAPGGKMRTMPSLAGPVDAGPTVLTLRPVFEELFAAVGEDLSAHLTLTRLTILARHFWQDGATLDLMADPEESDTNIALAFGARAVADFRAFRARTARLFAAFDAPMMQAARPSQRALTAQVLRQPRLIADMAPHLSLAAMLKGAFRDPHLAQLFARYATYVGGSPFRSPALLSLIAEAEAQGVWAIHGGMHRLARTLESLARARGAVFHYGTRAQKIDLAQGRATGVTTTAGRFAADAVLFNGDPRALACGLLGDGARRAVPAPAVAPRSLSAYVHAFAATPGGPPLAYHNVFFGPTLADEFRPLDRGEPSRQATLYVCAQDRAAGTPQGPERFEIILNGPPTGDRPEVQGDSARCQTQVFDRLARFGLTFSPRPGPAALTTPHGFARLFPASQGSLYGRSPQGLTAGLKRPRAQTAVPGLFLAGGGAHPGAGVPMAALSARHAAAAILTALASRSTFRGAAMPGGTSTDSAMTGRGASASSAS